MPRLRTWAMACVISLLAMSAVAGVHMTFETESDARQRRGAEIAADLALRLPSLLETFKAHRRELRLDATGQSYVASDVAGLLGSTESALLGALAAPDLAPLRDYVAERYRIARDRLGLQHAAALGKERRPFRSLPASFAAEQTADRNEAEEAFDGLMTFIEKVLSRSKAQQLTVTLCVVSNPEGAVFTMRAPSLVDSPYQTVTIGEVVNAFRGLYAYRVTKNDVTVIDCQGPPPGQSWECTGINLWDDPPVLECNLEQRACRKREPRPGDCR